MWDWWFFDLAGAEFFFFFFFDVIVFHVSAEESGWFSPFVTVDCEETE
jgi:hypothetical protein